MLSFLACVAIQSAINLPPSRFAPFEHGFIVEAGTLRAESPDTRTACGGQATIALSQTQPTPLLISGWSRADRVSGMDDRDYAIYIDAVYTDGTPLWGLATPFSVGTHGWERQEVLVSPARPLKSITVYALFRNHSGTSWFRDFSVQTLQGDRLFDGRFQNPPNVPTGPKAATLKSLGSLTVSLGAKGQILPNSAAGQVGGFFISDLGKDSLLLAGKVKTDDKGGASIAGVSQGLRWKGAFTRRKAGFDVELDLQDLSRKDRAVTAYLALPVDATGWRWGSDIRRADPIVASQEYSGLTTVPIGAVGAMSVYPIACVSNDQEGIVLGNSMGQPSVYRIFYSGPRRQLVIAWDVALTSKAQPRFDHRAELRCWIEALSPGEAKWGFRAAASHMYSHDPEAFRRRANGEGIWMPFTSPATIDRPEDFHIAYHEGDNRVADDDRLGIRSLRYTEPMSNWMPMAPNEPRTYENAIRILKENAESGDPQKRDPARATLSSGTQDRNGRFNLQFRNEPWCNGAVFVLNPNPHLPTKKGWPTKATLNYTPALGDREYASPTKGLDGEYLDSLESWSETLDYRPQNLKASPYAPTYDRAGRPVLPQWFSTYAFARDLSDDLHRRGRILMANSTPIQYSVFAGLLDVMGIETNWLSGTGEWQPMDDATFCLRRTLSYQRPYLLLQNTNFDHFTNDHVRRYFQRCAAYAVFPSMFSADAATHPYWEDPKLYNRDRPLFAKWIPIIAKLSHAGWQPVTFATCDSAQVGVERYGSKYLTLFNDSPQTRTIKLSIDRKSLHWREKRLVDRDGHPLPLDGSDISISLAPEECQIIEAR